ncbi:MAG: right-handed parallel beta-helix repeat-containing protein, partial [Candidatus Babeliales bacterium]
FSCGSASALPPCYPIPISGPTTIMTAGIYNLITSIIGTITIAANNVDLDLCSYQINAAGAAHAINATGNDLKIHNGTVTGATTAGLHVSGSQAIIIQDIRALANTDALGISLASTNTCCSLINCTATKNSTGFQDLGSAATRIVGAMACDNSADGFSLRANELVASKIYAKSNGSDGIRISGTSFLIDLFTALNNSGHGLHIESQSGVATQNGICYQGNSAGNGSTGIFLDANSEDISNVMIESCKIMSNGTHGISCDGNSATVMECQMCDNEILSNGLNGIILAVGSGQTERIQIINNKLLRNGVGIAGPVFGITIGGGIFVAGGAGATATTHEIFGNKAAQNGTNAPSSTTTNYSNNVQASPASGPASPNGLVVLVASGVGVLENISS